MKLVEAPLTEYVIYLRALISVFMLNVNPSLSIVLKKTIYLFVDFCGLNKWSFIVLFHRHNSEHIYYCALLLLLSASNKTLNIFPITDAINLANFGKFTDYF